MQWQKYIIKPVIILLAAILPSVAANANFISSKNTDITLYSNNSHELIAAISPHKGWHIYWQNPGDIGQPTNISAKQGNAQITNQSVPQHRLAYEIMHEYFYDNTAYYKLYIPSFSDTVLAFEFTECRDVCRPRMLEFDLKNLTPTPLEEWNNIEQIAAQTFPEKIKIYAKIGKNSAVIKNMPAENLQFIPALPHVVVEDSLSVEPKGKKWLVSWQTEENKSLSQALILADNKAYIADIIYTENQQISLLYILLLAFLGGIILNAMPCVFPILSLKIFALLQVAHTKKRWRPAIFYTLGVWISFMLLTALLIILKKQGEAIGWGFQLQSPWFVGIMALIFIMLFLAMLELIRFPSFSNNFIHHLAGLNDFTTGFFAVLIASPCTGPFMGAAVGYAFMQSSCEIFAVFTSLALGYALPYVLIELYPQTLSRILPKPGAWMRKVKIVLSIPILLTAVWLLWVLATQLHANWSKEKPEALEWSAYDAAKVETLAADGENVFIDFTAKWCLTCQFNDKFMLQSEDFQNFVKQNNVHLFKADLTEDNDIYNAALSSYGRDGIPVYIYYTNGQYAILPVFFTIAQLSEKLN